MISLSLLSQGLEAPFLSKVLAGLKGDRTEVHSFIATECELLMAAHLRQEAPNRHKTANKIGAQPTGHLKDAAESLESSGTKESAEVSWPRNTGLQRAFRDLRIRPTGGRKFLTIPVAAESYGRRARDFEDLFFRSDQRGRLFLSREADGSDGMVENLFLLVRESNIPQDRTLLPSDQQFAQAAELGVRDWIDSKRGGGNG